MVDGAVYFRENSRMVRPDLNATAEARIKGMVRLRDCVQELIDLQMDAATPDSDIREKQVELNQLYDDFSAKYGLINDRGNRLALQELSMTHFDCWASRFGETTTALELAPEGTGYRARTRFSKFFNLPELMNLFKEVADIKTADQLHLPTPEVEYHNIVAQPTEQQQEMVKALSERASLVPRTICSRSPAMAASWGWTSALSIRRCRTNLAPRSTNVSQTSCRSGGTARLTS